MNTVRRLALGLAAAALCLAPAAANAWKPYTHNYTASLVLEDVDFATGKVTIAGRQYAIVPELAAAIASCTDCYNAGVIGPDGFPDLVYGQSVIHPVETGEWLGHILRSAHEAQSSPAYDAAEKQRILAFSYGYLTHAAGDMWAHTVVNEFAEGVFPGVTDILTSLDAASIAAKHLIVEGYIGDMTHGFDGNPARSIAPGTYGAADGDVSDDSTPGYAYTAPHRFIYDTLVSPEAGTPIAAVPGNYLAARGNLIGGFLELRESLRSFIESPFPNPLEDALEAYDDTLMVLAELEDACDFDDIGDVLACPAKLLELGFTIVIDSAEAFANFVVSTTIAAARLVLDAYLAAWIADIDEGLRHWSELGMATTKGLFDAQTRRFLQNEECKFEGGEDTLNRGLCEEGVGTLDVVFEEADPFINDYALSMLGLPDFVGDVRAAVGEISDVFGEILGVIGLPFNPLDEALTQMKEWMKDLVVDQISDTLGFDVEALNDFLHEPHRFVCLPTVDFGFGELSLFDNQEHHRVMVYMGTTDVTPIPEPGLPPGCGRLPDYAEWDPEEFAPVKNTVLMGKLLLLQPGELNRLVEETLGGHRQISTYGAGQNVMVRAMTGTSPTDTWLRLIDGDHAWRADGAPVFGPRDDHSTAGKGSFPIWESCVMRPAFRALFKDWENPWNAADGHGPDPALVALLQFPDHGDVASEDPDNDPQAPASAISVEPKYVSGATTFVAASHVIQVTAIDAPAGKAFLPHELGLYRRIRSPLDPAGAWTVVGQAEGFSVSGPDGTYHVDYQSEDPCHTIAPDLPGEPEPVKTQALVLDQTPPVTTCHTPPFALTWDTDDLTPVDYSITDGAIGSGIAATSATIDGRFLADGSVGPAVPTTDGATIDMFLHAPGLRTVAVYGKDHVGNEATTSCTFELHATAASLLSNLDRSHAEGFIPKSGTYFSLRAKLEAAKAAHDRGQHATEANVLGAFVNELEAQAGQGIDAGRAAIFITFAQDLIAIGG